MLNITCHSAKFLKPALFGAMALTVASFSATSQSEPIAGLMCETPPPQHCPDKDCPGELVIATGEVVDPKTDRKFFLDYPCDWKPGEKLTFVLNLHGGGSYGNWQRHYFPIFDFVDQYRLVVATPHSPTRAWVPQQDDEHLHNIVDMVYGHFGKDNIKAFWLAGHSQGGQTSNRLLMEKDWIQDKLVGWVSLSGGRLGSPRSSVRAGIPSPPRPEQAAPPSEPQQTRSRPPLVAYPAEKLPDYAFTHIYESGEHEYPATGLPNNSLYAEKLGCDARKKLPDVVDTKAGYVFDSSRAPETRNKIWGMEARPGRAEVYVYDNCEGGNIVADIVRMDKGHTEGLEPKITEEIIKMMMAVSK